MRSIQSWCQRTPSFELDGLLLVLERALVEERPQLLVAVVDGELLKAVDLEVLEAGNVQHTNEGLGAVKGEAEVDTSDDPVEQLEYRALANALRPTPSLAALPLRTASKPGISGE